jgi:hypothetical protein
MATLSGIQALKNAANWYLTEASFSVVEIETIMSNVFCDNSNGSPASSQQQKLHHLWLSQTNGQMRTGLQKKLTYDYILIHFTMAHELFHSLYTFVAMMPGLRTTPNISLYQFSTDYMV